MNGTVNGTSILQYPEPNTPVMLNRILSSTNLLHPKLRTPMHKQPCCHLTSQEPLVQCENPGVWCCDVYGEPYMETYACDHHLVGMLELERTNVVVYVGED